MRVGSSLMKNPFFRNPSSSSSLRTPLVTDMRPETNWDSPSAENMPKSRKCPRTTSRSAWWGSIPESGTML